MTPHCPARRVRVLFGSLLAALAAAPAAGAAAPPPAAASSAPLVDSAPAVMTVPGPPAGARRGARTGKSTATAAKARHQAAAKGAAPTSLSFRGFGKVAVYKPTGTPTDLTLFFSGDGGWNAGVVDMARALTRHGSVVVGIDTPRYLKSAQSAKGPCMYPPGDLQMLSQFVQKKLGTRRYLEPIVAGYSSGATLAYTSLVQAPSGTFAGALSLGFCSDLEVTKPLCKGFGLVGKALVNAHPPGFDYAPIAKLKAPWALLQGKIDQVCTFAKAALFAKAIPDAHFYALEKVGHGFAVGRNWQPQYEAAFDEISRGQGADRARKARRPHAGADAAPARAGDAAGLVAAGGVAEPSDLPLVESLPPPEAPVQAETLAVLLSGDGGWASFDDDLAAKLAAAGVPVVGLNSLQYFWSERTPETAAADLSRVIAYYLGAWRKRAVLLVGYSFGADVLPFMVARLPPALAAHIKTVALVGPSAQASFEFNIGDWIAADDETRFPVVAELKRLKPHRLLCFYGKEDEDAVCPQLASVARNFVFDAGHKLNDHIDTISREILTAAEN